MNPRNFAEIKIIEAFEKQTDDCPICELIYTSVEKFIEEILYEFVNDPNTRSRLRHGICSKHVLAIENTLNNHPELGLLGLAIIYEDIMSEMIKDMVKNCHTESECLFCKHESESEKIYVETCTSFISDILSIYEKSKRILCRDHYWKIFSTTNHINQENLKAIQVKKLLDLKSKLTVFIEKHDYRKDKQMGDTPRACKIAGMLISNNRIQDGRNRLWLWRFLPKR